MSTRPERPLVKSRWSSTIITRIVASPSMLKTFKSLHKFGSAYAYCIYLTLSATALDPTNLRVLHPSHGCLCERNNHRTFRRSSAGSFCLRHSSRTYYPTRHQGMLRFSAWHTHLPGLYDARARDRPSPER